MSEDLGTVGQDLRGRFDDGDGGVCADGPEVRQAFNRPIERIAREHVHDVEIAKLYTGDRQIGLTCTAESRATRVREAVRR